MEPTGPANARPMINSAKSGNESDAGPGLRFASSGLQTPKLNGLFTRPHQHRAGVARSGHFCLARTPAIESGATALCLIWVRRRSRGWVPIPTDSGRDEICQTLHALQCTSNGLPQSGDMIPFELDRSCVPNTVVCSSRIPTAMAEIRDIKSGRSGEPPREPSPRRLAAIVAGDIAGYSRLMQIDEEGTHNRVKRIERDLIEPSIAEHHGKLVKTTGDGFIAIFDSPVEAVRCSIVIQQNMVGRKASLPKHHWIVYRFGINLGDVIIETDDVYGDGVNIASRLDGIADPGQVYISGGIYEQIKHKLVCGYESLGDRKIKNITDPVRVYRVLPDPAAFNKTRKRRENVLIFLLSLALLIIAGGALWYLLSQPHDKMRDQAASVSPPMPKEPQNPTAPPPVAKQAAPQPPPVPPSSAQPTAPQPQQSPSVAPAAKQAAPLPQ